MKLKMWGTRGSLPRAMSTESILSSMQFLLQTAKNRGATTLEEFEKFMQNPEDLGFEYLGGQTTNWEIRSENNNVFVDMGTGITDACVEAMNLGQTEFDICLTHMHWDHVMGLPFFVPIYSKGSKIRIHHVHANAEPHIRLLFNGVNFPVKWEELGATVEFVQHKLYEDFTIGDIEVQSFALDHPGGSFGYRFNSEGKSVAIGIDGEYKRITPDELGKDLYAYQNLDLLVFDAQYEMNELASRFDWGHSSPPIGVDLALREGIRNLALAHHDPRGTEARSQRMLKLARRHCESQVSAYKKIWTEREQPEGPNIFLGYDGLLLDLDKL